MVYDPKPSIFGLFVIGIRKQNELKSVVVI